MQRVEKMRAFIIRVLYVVIWAAIIYGLFKYALPLFMPFLIAFLIAFLLKPLINFIERKTPFGRRLIGVVLLVLFYAVAGTLLALLGIKIVVTVSGWFADLPGLYKSTIEPAITEMGNSLDGFTAALDPAVAGFLDTASNNISSAVSNIVSAVSQSAINIVAGAAARVPWAVVGTVLCAITSFFFVVDYYRITAFLARQLPPRSRRLLFDIKNFVVNVLFKFGRAYLLLMSITFAEVSIGLLIIGVPNPFLIAFFTAIVDILPVFGTGSIMIPWALYNFVTGNISGGIALAALYAVVTVVRQFLEPRIVGHQIGLYPLLTLITMFLGARLFGFWGLFGFPVALTVLIYLNRTGEIHLFREDRPQNALTGAPPRGGEGG